MISAKTNNQKEYIRSVIENDIVFVDGCYGVGKTYIAIGLASQWMNQGKIDKILVCRSVVECGKEIGALPGELQEKIYPYFVQHIGYFDEFLGKNDTKKCIKDGEIELVPVELLRGSSYKNTLMILDEAQNCTKTQLILFLTRMDVGSKIIVLGDSSQCDLKYNDFAHIIESDLKYFSFIKLGKDDIMRNKDVYFLCHEINELFK